MRNLRKLAILAIGLGVSSMSLAYWTSASLESERENGMYYRICNYQTLDGYRFSIQVKGFCPISVRVDPETGQYQK
ncbi:hypothetical protein FW755_01400 [Lonepinella koalarum]|uniref:Secreted protein n=1 Tax=Lonepinella koalarum TaxID=53417 RepID=A0A4R1KYH7_9PAST|nr:hypothetical protein [Lonepinella koalarum]MDH2926787.1 hypothetical protein [Lonepinella koalarum]TCK70555.1 hypothetical protein EV692_0835 [Lonepinella koalarum]TFJ90064.1 hypothetical protein E0709_05315 [Lonepinella koalarum]TYG33839.1 hypothetical protein FW755_01400 [Lonepinella koalarum]